MDEAQARQLLRRYGWTAFVRTKPSGRYLLARRRSNGKRISIYIAAMSRLAWHGPEDIKRKLPEEVA